jgi:hypothetical protein
MVISETRPSTEIYAWFSPSKGRLLVDVTIPLQLRTVLENRGDAEQQQHVDAHNAKGGGEDEVQVAVGKGREWADATNHLRGRVGVRADVADDKGWRHGVEIATALELPLSDSTLQRMDY